MRSLDRHTLSFAAAVLLALPAASSAQEESIRISNFPLVQEVTGGVEIADPVPANEIKRFTDVVVTTVKRRETTRLVSAGVLEAGPFTAVKLSLGVLVEGIPPEPATVGAVLVPDEDFVTNAFDEGIYLFPIEVTLGIPKDALAYVGAQPELHNLAFPRYRVYFYNSGPRTVKAQLYAFLIN
jgi:hypothetical protein